MKVYVVYGTLSRGDYCDRLIYNVFDSYEKAEDYAIKISRKAFDENRVAPKDRKYTRHEVNKEYSNEVLSIMDIADFFVEIYVCEWEVQ